MPKGFSSHNQRGGKTLIERLEHYSMPEPNSGCLLWLGAATNGYGVVYAEGRRHSAHRAAWMLRNGPIPSGKVICHKCDVPGCINPDHLFLGTHADNVADKVAKGRQTRGERHSTARLTEDQAREIIFSGERIRDIAARFGILPQEAYRIRIGERWAHLGARPDCPRLVLRGNHHPRAKITEADAVAIFNDPRGARPIALEYGVTRGCIRRIRRGTAWRHVTGAPLLREAA